MIDLKDKKDCCGCSACVQKCSKQCISLKEDFEGFLYPEIDKNLCIDCGLCEKVCPVINQNEPRTPIKVYAAKNKNELIRLESSSGGIFTLLAEHVLKLGGVVFGARFNEDWEVVHAYAETMEGVAAFRGSKYVQSRIGDTYMQAEQFLKEGRKVLFSGTPCQIAGLKLFLRKEYNNLLAVDFVCHGVPSPKVFQMYLDETIAREDVDGKNTVLSHPVDKRRLISNIKFRDKKYGWKKYSFLLSFSIPSGGRKNTALFREPVNENLFLKGFLKDLYLRPSCYQCPSKSLKSDSDLTIADYWGIHYFLPEFDDDKGVSLVMVNSIKGDYFYQKLEVESIETSYVNALRNNPSINNSAIEPIDKENFYNKINNHTIYYLISKLASNSIKKRLKTKIFYIVNKMLKKLKLVYKLVK